MAGTPVSQRELKTSFNEYTTFTITVSLMFLIYHTIQCNSSAISLEIEILALLSEGRKIDIDGANYQLPCHKRKV